MSKTSVLWGALLALTTLTSTADAGMLGGVSAPTGLSRIESRIPMTGSVGLSGRTFNADGLQLRTRSEHWRKPIDSDGGGPDDPPKKPSGDGTKTGSSDGDTSHYVAPRHGGHSGSGHYGPHGEWHPDPPLACKGRPPPTAADPERCCLSPAPAWSGRCALLRRIGAIVAGWPICHKAACP